MARGAGLRPKAKGLDKPPDPTVRAPALDPTGRGRMEKGCHRFSVTAEAYAGMATIRDKMGHST